MKDYLVRSGIPDSAVLVDNEESIPMPAPKTQRTFCGSERAKRFHRDAILPYSAH